MSVDFTDRVWPGSYQLDLGSGVQGVDVGFDRAWGPPIWGGVWWHALSRFLADNSADDVVSPDLDQSVIVELMDGLPLGPVFMVDASAFPNRARFVQSVLDLLRAAAPSWGARLEAAMRHGLSAMHAWNGARKSRVPLLVADLPAVLSDEGFGSGVVSWAVGALGDRDLEAWAHSWLAWDGREVVVGEVRSHFGQPATLGRCRAVFRLDGDPGSGLVR